MIIYFFPYDLEKEHNRPSLKRPLKMLNAFKKISTKEEVIEVIGKLRKKKIHQIQEKLKQGLANDIQFIYVESINKPLFLQRIFERDINIFGDYYFFWKCRKNNIPLGLYYRDALWVTPEFRNLAPKYCYHILKFLFFLEFKLLEYLFDVFFLPSSEMAQVLPWDPAKVVVCDLPPAADDKQFILTEELDVIDRKKDIVFIYVGNINPDFYDISPLLNVVANDKNIKLNLCCRKNDWDQFNGFYSNRDNNNIFLHHVDNDKLAKIYQNSDIHFMLFAEDAYRNFSIPFKFFESLQYGVPIITNDGTKVASLVREFDVGWVVKNESDANKLINDLNLNQSLILAKKKNIARVIKDNTWESRAKKVTEVLKKN